MGLCLCIVFIFVPIIHSLECLQWLVEHGNSDPSIFANDGMNPLHAAAQAGELSCMKWLVNHGGVSPRQKAEDGATPMHFAASGGKVLIFMFISYTAEQQLVFHHWSVLIL